MLSNLSILYVHAYKVQLTHQLKPTDHSQRRRYDEWVLEQQTVDANFSNKIFFSDDALFTLFGYVNKQNYRIWGSENLQVIEKRPLHPEKFTFWCALWSEGVIGPYFFENDDEMTVTVHSERYGHMITAIEVYDLGNIWFQQDDAICHTTPANMALLQETFSGRIIARRGDINWPSRTYFYEAKRKTVSMQKNLQLQHSSSYG